MSEQSLENDVRVNSRELPVLSKERREFPRREKQPMLKETDENGDVIFRFKLDLSETNEEQTLENFYRASIRDLLKIVRFYSKGETVILDSFAFLNRPHEQIRILEEPADD